MPDIGALALLDGAVIKIGKPVGLYVTPIRRQVKVQEMSSEQGTDSKAFPLQDSRVLFRGQ